MIKIYPAIFENDPAGIAVYFPDLEDSATQGKTIEEAMINASDLLGIQLAWNIENKLGLPKPSEIKDLDIAPQTQFATLIQVELADYLKDNKPVKKTIQIPRWLNIRAEKEGVNFSKTMTDALLQKLEA